MDLRRPRQVVGVLLFLYLFYTGQNSWKVLIGYMRYMRYLYVQVLRKELEMSGGIFVQQDQVRHIVPVTLGGDPEFFFERGGKVIGAEKVLSEDGVKVKMEGSAEFKAFVLDGVQVELNPRPHTCRTGLGQEISLAFRTLREHLEKLEGGVSASLKTTIDLDKEELDSLSDKSKVFGCAPSLNLYDQEAKIEVDASTYLKRSAGGHIHLGLGLGSTLFQNRQSLIPILDVLLALPCVLIDRDEGNVERRKHYGRAGEHRLPRHGLEYRTLSNFWLRSFPLTSFVMAQARLACDVLAMEVMRKNPSVSWNLWPSSSSLLKEVDMRAVQEAINLNDLDLAKECWEPVSAWLSEHTQVYTTGLVAHTLPAFSYFAEKVQKQGIEAWFPDDPITHWCNLSCSDNHGGWESFLRDTVLTAKEKEQGQEHPF